MNLLIISPNAMTSKGRLNLSWIIFFAAVITLKSCVAVASSLLLPMPPPPTITMRPAIYILFNFHCETVWSQKQTSYAGNYETTYKDREARERQQTRAHTNTHTHTNTSEQHEQHTHNRLVGSSTKADYTRLMEIVRKPPIQAYQTIHTYLVYVFAQCTALA